MLLSLMLQQQNMFLRYVFEAIPMALTKGVNCNHLECCQVMKCLLLLLLLLLAWRLFLSRREVVRRSPRARRLAFRLPPYDTPHVAPRNNPEFHVDRTHAAGGVCEQTKTALRKYIDR